MNLTEQDIAGMEQRVNRALAELRPFLEADGGDITLEEVTPEGIARVKLHGACQGCAMVSMTMKAGVEEAIKRIEPRVSAVVAVNADPSC